MLLRQDDKISGMNIRADDILLQDFLQGDHCNGLDSSDDIS